MNNFRIASILSKVHWSETDKACIHDHLNAIRLSMEQQKEFFTYCEKWKLAPWTYTQLLRNKLISLLKEEIQQAFYEAHAKTQTQNEKRNAEAIRFLKVFKENNIDVVILKGNYLAHTVYQDPGYKRMNDFDILIHMKDWDKIQDIYLSLGFIPLGFGWSGEKQKAAKFSHVGMSFISPDFSCIVGSQWGLKSPTTSYRVNIEEAWATAVDFDFFGVMVKRLSTEYNLLHLVLHMGVYKCGIRDCMDVYNLLMIESLNVSRYMDIATKAHAIDKTMFTLRLCDVCSNTMGDLIEEMKASGNSFILRRLKRRLKMVQRSGDLHDSYNDYFQDIEKVVIYFNLFPKFHKKIVFYFVILKLIYFPKRKVALKLSDQPAHANLFIGFKARLKAPYFVFSLIAQEIGWKFTFLLFVKLLLDVIVSLKNYFVRTESYFDYLHKRGIDPEQIKKAVKNIQ